MATATVTEISAGRKTNKIYVKSKSGNTYRFHSEIPVQKRNSFMQRVMDAGVINTKHWTKVQKSERTVNNQLKLSLETASDKYADAYCAVSELINERSTIRGVKDPEHEAAIEQATLVLIKAKADYDAARDANGYVAGFGTAEGVA